MSQLRTCLAELGLEEYYDSLLENGIDTWEQLGAIDEADMAIIGIRLGHRRRLQREIATQQGHSTHRSLFDMSQATREKRVQGDKEVETARRKRKYKRRPLRDRHAPSRPDTGYVAFAKHLRQDPGISNLSFVEIAKLVGTQWSSVSDEEKHKWNARAAAQREIYNQQLVRYHQTDLYRLYVEQSITGKSQGRQVKNPIERNTLVETSKYRSQSSGSSLSQVVGYAQAESNPSQLDEDSGQLQTTLLPNSSVASYTSNGADVPQLHNDSTYDIYASRWTDADMGVPILKTIQTMMSGGQESNLGAQSPMPRQQDLSQYIFQHSALSTSFHVQAINPFDHQAIAVLLPVVDSFLQNVNSVYYLVNPDNLRNHLYSVFDTSYNTPNYIMAKVCLCISLGYQTCDIVTDDSAIMWYENGRRYLDDYDWCFEPTVMQLLALVSMFHMSQRPATSSHYLDTAVHIGKSNNFHKMSRSCHHLDDNSDEWLHIWDTLQTMHRVLVLGCGTSGSILQSWDALSDDMANPLSPPDITRAHFASPSCSFSNLSCILGSLLQVQGDSQGNKIRLGDTDLSIRNLKLWLYSQPKELSLAVNPETGQVDILTMTSILSEASDANKAELLHFHSLYVGIMGLLTRSSLEHSLAALTKQNQSKPQTREIEENAYECLNSAFQLIDLCRTLCRTSSFPVYAWLPLCVLFTSSLVCTIGVVWQRRLLSHNISATDAWLLRSTDKMQDVLYIFEHCAVRSEQAQRRYLVLQQIVGWLDGD